MGFPARRAFADGTVKISIVTPVYNEVRVGRALDSVLGQVHNHELETIVVDGGSSAPTQQVLARYKPRLTSLVSEPDSGIYDGMNKGIRRATGDVIGILNADDRYAHTRVLGEVLEVFERRQDVQACYGNMLYVNDLGTARRYWRSGVNRPYKWYFGWRPPHPAFFVRRDVYEAHGLFNVEYRIASDYELQLRLLFVQRVTCAHLDRVLVHMAPGGTSNRSLVNIVKANLESRRAWRRNGLSGGLLVPFLKPISKFPQFLRRPSRTPNDAAARPAAKRGGLAATGAARRST